MKLKKIKPWNSFQKIDLKEIDKQSKKAEVATMRHAHKFLVSRFENLRHIRRHLAAWLVLVMILIGLNALQIVFNEGYLGVDQPARNGSYGEGVVGPINNLNPLFASTDAELSASKLMFSSLASFDHTGRLQNEAAESISTIDSGKTYTVDLRPDMKWHDGEKLTADDVVYTVKTMQNPLVKASQFSSWQGIQVAKTGPNQVTFTLPTSYAPFTAALTFPILPRHILAKIDPAKLQENNFNDHPIGSGPFKFVDFHAVESSKQKSALQLTRNNDYFETPTGLGRFSLYVYDNKKDLSRALEQRQINAASGVKVVASGIKNTDVPLNNGVYALLRTNSQILQDTQVRKALAQGLNRIALRKNLKATQALEGPIVNNQTLQANQVTQLAFDKTAAETALDADGWVKNAAGVREKGGVPLELRMVAVDTGNYKKITAELAKQWESLGVKIEVQLIDPEQIQQVILRPRAYDILVYELSMGGDPDGYAFWHSSQASGSGLNFSNYVSASADDALLTARGRTNISLRDAKYATFAKKWVEDVPAIALYRSSFQYSTTEATQALQPTDVLVSPTDRYYSVLDWASEKSTAYNTP